METMFFALYSCTAGVKQCGLTWPTTSLSRFMKDEDAFFTQTLSSRLWASSALISNSNLQNNIPDDDTLVQGLLKRTSNYFTSKIEHANTFENIKPKHLHNRML